MLHRVKHLNESRLQRDITLCLIPSPEILRLWGEEVMTELGEEINMDWIRCQTIGSTRLKPDLTVGLMPLAFSQDKTKTLQNYASPEFLYFFTPNLYFPFLTCEAKSSQVGLDVVDGQNLYSAAISSPVPSEASEWAKDVTSQDQSDAGSSEGDSRHKHVRHSGAAVATMRTQIAQLMEQLTQQREELAQQREGNTKQLALQREESTRQLAQQREDSAKQMSQLMEQLTQQREDSAKQLAHLQQIIDVLSRKMCSGMQIILGTTLTTNIAMRVVIPETFKRGTRVDSEPTNIRINGLAALNAACNTPKRTLKSLHASTQRVQVLHSIAIKSHRNIDANAKA
ncbi:MAG: hypothetical protein Q9159_007626 [Coniocarpon cinnabarinum]